MFKGIRIDKEEVQSLRERVFGVLRWFLVVPFVFLAGLFYGSISTTEVQAEPQPTATVEVSEPTPAAGSLAECPLTEKVSWASEEQALAWDATRRWCGLMVEASKTYDLNVHLLAALIWWESGGNPDIIADDGGVGLMQVMPRDGAAANVMCEYGPCFADRPTTAELQDPAFNIDYGSSYLAGKILATGSLRDGLKAYGPYGVGYTYADTLIELAERIRP